MISAYAFTGLSFQTKRQVIDSLNPDKFAKANIIINVICEYLKIPPEDIKSQSRKRHKTVARQLSMYWIKQKTTLSLKCIGAMFGGRDHSTVIYAIQTVNDLMETDRRFAKTVSNIENLLQSISKDIYTQPEIPTVGSN